MNRFEVLKMARIAAPWVISMPALVVALTAAFQGGWIASFVILLALVVFHFIRDGILSGE